MSPSGDRDRDRDEGGQGEGEGELPETITLRVAGGASITLDADGITLDNGKGAVVTMRAARGGGQQRLPSR